MLSCCCCCCCCCISFAFKPISLSTFFFREEEGGKFLWNLEGLARVVWLLVAAASCCFMYHATSQAHAAFVVPECAHAHMRGAQEGSACAHGHDTHGIACIIAKCCPPE